MEESALLPEETNEGRRQMATAFMGLSGLYVLVTLCLAFAKGSGGWVFTGIALVGQLVLLMALNVPVALAVLFYQTIRGENAHMAAKAVCVTALGVVLNDSGMAGQAMMLL